MRRVSVCLPLAALLIPAALAPAAAQVSPATTQTPPSRTLTVSASADVPAVPDQGVVQLGATTRGSTAQSAMAQNNDIMSKVIAALKQLGIPDMNIQTSQLSLSPVYEQPTPETANMPPRLIGFDATNIVSIILTDPTKIGPAIDAGIAAGANQIQGISFRLSDDQPFRLMALQQAGGRAKAKAEALAAGLGVTLGDVDAVTEGTPAVPTPVYAGAAPSAATPTPVSPGQVMVHVDIQVRYFLK
jgi:uncharacterized protein YggE